MNKIFFAGGVAAILGSFPEKYLGTMSSGSAMGGLIPSLLNVAIIGASENSAQTVGFICFLICTLISISCFIVSFLIKKNEYFKHHGVILFQNKVNSEHKVHTCFEITSQKWIIQYFTSSIVHIALASFYYYTAE